MNRRLYIIAIMVMVLGCVVMSAQELNCVVEVNSEQVPQAPKSLFTTLEGAIRDYMNTTKFSQAQVAANEKIDCRLFFTIKEYSDDGVLKGDLQIQSTRPVYNTSYTTTLINFKDTKIEFSYQENEPLVFSETTMESNLTAILNYYAYLIMGVDFDTFSPRGGEQFYDRAKLIVQMGQSAGESGWRAFEDTKNRASVLSAFTDPATAQLSDMLYTYHRRGLEEMATSADKGRAQITA
ncbi:MAG: DUF4835 family protein, partial [Muribaculaceae bacterium]|nr:DUF4835 family protein [Muribaculaceae bacterium]